jgi:LPXTG-site transpeptidase (sortase) family protein
MSDERSRIRNWLTSLRWGRLAVVAGILLALVGAWLEFRAPTDSVGAVPTVTNTPAPTVVVSSRPSTPPSASATATRSPTPTASPKPTPRQTSRHQSGRPDRLLLPDLGVSARVVAIRAEGGALNPPRNPRVVGWWSGGARPGARIGSAVMTGHTVHNGGGVFDNLDKLRVGATVVVQTSAGRITYVARSVTNYPKRSFGRQAAKVFDQSVPGRLVLVTCEDWTGEVYLSNSVVIAEPVG